MDILCGVCIRGGIIVNSVLIKFRSTRSFRYSNSISGIWNVLLLKKFLYFFKGGYHASFNRSFSSSTHRILLDFSHQIRKIHKRLVKITVTIVGNNMLIVRRLIAFKDDLWL